LLIDFQYEERRDLSEQEKKDPRLRRLQQVTDSRRRRFDFLLI